MAAPSMLESKIRRNAVPKVWPKPRSNGSNTTLAWVGLIALIAIERGVSNSFTAVIGLPQVKLLRIELNDQAFVNFCRQITTLRQCFEGTFKLVFVNVNPFNKTTLLRKFHCRFYTELVFRFLAHRNNIASTHLKGSHIHSFTINEDCFMAH